LGDKNTVGHVLFDLDETMYAKDLGVMELIDQRINAYMSGRLGMDPADVVALRRKYYQEYGTTGRGLFLHHDLDVADYYQYVHDLPIEDVVQPDRRLDEMLDSLEAEKAIFTNATAEHALRVLGALRVERHFGHIIGIKEMEYVPKPDIRAYQRALELLQARAHECLLVDDRLRNLSPGRVLGMITVLVGGGEAEDGADFVVEDVTQVGQVVEAIRARDA
jgi:putative hydrolase of the HAD superfamily